MAISKITKLEDLISLEPEFIRETGRSDHDELISAAFNEFLVDFAADVTDPVDVVNSDENFRSIVARKALMIAYESLSNAEQDRFGVKAKRHEKRYWQLMGKIRFEVSGDVSGTDFQASGTIERLG